MRCVRHLHDTGRKSSDAEERGSLPNRKSLSNQSKTPRVNVKDEIIWLGMDDQTPFRQTSDPSLESSVLNQNDKKPIPSANENGPQRSKEFDPSPLRRWLEGNKIFFEVGIALLFGIATVVVSWLQFEAADRQNQLVDRQNRLVEAQTELARAQASPQFVISTEMVHDQLTGDEVESEVRIENRNGFIRELSCDTAEFLELEVWIWDRGPKAPAPMRLDTFSLPVRGYYRPSRVFSYAGEPLRMFGHGNEAHRAKLVDGLKRVALPRNLLCIAKFKWSIRLEYRDLLGRKCEEFFRIDPVSRNGLLLSRDEGEKIFAEWKSSLAMVQEFETLNPTNLWVVIRTKLKQFGL